MNIIFTVFLFLLSTVQLMAATIDLEIIDLENDNGQIKLHLFNSAEGFPTKGKTAFQTHILNIDNKRAVLIIKDIPEGVYAIAYFHDQNKNSKLDTNWLGIPSEGFGFSNNAKNMLSAPNFEQCRFEIKETEPNKITLTVRYGI